MESQLQKLKTDAKDILEDNHELMNEAAEGDCSQSESSSDY